MNKKSLATLEFHKVLDRLAQYTSFSASETLARELRPTADLEEARRWQIETQEARLLTDKRNDMTVGGARDVRRIADNAQRGFILQPEDLMSVRATISAGRDLKRKLVKLNEEYPHLAQIAELIEECPGLVSAIGSTFDERGEMLDSASPELADIRRQVRIVHGRIQDKLRTLLSSSMSQYLQEPTITTRGGRYVVPLQANYKGRIKGIVHDQSNSGATLWIEPLNTVDLNNEYRQLQLAEEEEIQRILAILSGMVSQQGDAVKRVVERLAELDLIFARAHYANSLDAIMPEFVAWRPRKMTSQSVAHDQPGEPYLHPGSTMWIRGARHPLLAKVSVVPTDLLVDEGVFIVLITGPNTGGKTVSLKTTGLMVLMAQSGLHLPAVEAKLTLFDDVFADIGDEQSIEQNLSTFSGHMTNITEILGSAGERSLVLLDELGSGTDPTEGAALAQAIVGFLRDNGATTFVATHFPELKVYASRTPGATNASLLFDVETLMPTYEMSIGMPGRSNAFAIARRLGLDETILDDAMLLVGANNDEAERLLDSIYEMREQITSQEARTRMALRQATEERDKLQERLYQIEKERQQILDEAKFQAEEELVEVRREIRQIRRTLRDTASLNQLKKLQKRTEEIEEETQVDFEPETLIELPKKTRRVFKDFQIGDTVVVTALGARGKIVDLSKKDAEVAIGRLRMRASLGDLEFKEHETEDEEISPSFSRPKVESPGMELDLRGKRVDETLQLLEQYVDTAFLANLPWVRIIHGKGTGRLKEVVREALSANDHVISWEEGKDGEGGAGVTVAKLAID